MLPLQYVRILEKSIAERNRKPNYIRHEIFQNPASSIDVPSDFHTDDSQTFSMSVLLITELSRLPNFVLIVRNLTNESRTDQRQTFPIIVNYRTVPFSIAVLWTLSKSVLWPLLKSILCYCRNPYCAIVEVRTVPLSKSLTVPLLKSILCNCRNTYCPIAEIRTGPLFQLLLRKWSREKGKLSETNNFSLSSEQLT